MLNLILTATIFFISIILHVYLHRLLIKIKASTYKTIFIFGIGFLINLGLQLRSNLPLTNSLIFSLLSLVYGAFFISAFLKDVSPSFQILRIFRKHKLLEYKKIADQFTDYELVHKRLDELIKTGIVVEKNGRLSLGNKGFGSIYLIDLYLRLFTFK